MKIRVSSFLCALGALLLAWFAVAVSSNRAAESTFHHGKWPFKSPVRPAEPTIANSAWVRNPIDRFVAAGLEKVGLNLGAEADKAALIRRVTYDLIGLPPTTAELDAFLADKSDDAYTRLVDRLLASPRFGERWAQHWLDVVRYAETEGFKADHLRPSA